jgi:ribose transport system permease protein
MQLETGKLTPPVSTPPGGSKAAGPTTTRRSRLVLSGMQALGLGGFYLLTLVFFSIQAAPHFFSFSNAVNILSNVSVIGIVTLGQMLVLIAGGFDLSVAGTLPLGGVPGTVVGVLVLGTVANGLALMQVPAFYQQIATGSILLLAVGFGRLRALFGQLGER